MIKKIILTVLIIMIIAANYINAKEIFKSTATNVVDIYAEKMSYDRIEDIVRAWGSVGMEFERFTLTCDKGYYRRTENLIQAEGNIEFDTHKYKVQADSLEYNIANSTGIIYNAALESAPLYISADKINIISEDEFFIPRGGITTCDHQPPHYQFTGTDMRVKLDSSFSAYNAILKVRDIPTFYYPYYKKNLGPKKGGFDLDLGQSGSEGYYAKAKLYYPFTENSRTYAGVDFKSKKGIGFTAGHFYSTDKGKLDLDLAYLKNIFKERAVEEEVDRSIDDDEFILNLSGWQEIYENLNVRYRSEYTSSRDYNYRYRRFTDEEYYQQELFYQAGVEYADLNYKASMYGSKKEQWVEDSYEITEVVSPGVSLKLYPVRMPANFNFSGRADYQNRYVKTNRTMQPYFSWTGKIETSYRQDPVPFYYFTISPGIGYEGAYKRYSLKEDFLNHQANFSTGLNQGFFRALFLNTEYQFQRDLQDPYEVLRNLIRGRLVYRPYNFLQLSSQTRYDLTKVNQEPFDNFLSELNINMPPVDFSVRNRFSYHQREHLDWLFDLNYREMAGVRVKYVQPYPRRLEIENSLRGRLGNFEIYGGVKYNLEKNDTWASYGFSEFTEKYLTVNWDMHCWESEYRIIKRGNDIQFWVLVNIEAFPDDRAGFLGNVGQDDTGQIDSDFRFHRE